MPPKAIEGKGPAKMPRQFVRPGRGIAGYTGKVEVYDPVRATKSREVASQPEKVEALNLTRAQLNERAEKLGLNPNDYSNKDEITAAIAAVEG